MKNIKYSLLPLLGILFVVLKLTGTIAWSWWFVTLPFWIIPAIGLAGFAILLTMSLVFLSVFGFYLFLVALVYA